MEIDLGTPHADNDKRCEQLLSVQKALFIGAHPDDIEWYCGGLVHMLTKRGALVTFAIATRGGKGKRGWVKRWLEAHRSRDQVAAANILGGAGTILFRYPDKDLPRHVEEFARDVRNVIAIEQPDLILSWDPEHIFNPHPDHQAAADSVKLVAERSTVPFCYYGTRRPDLWLGYDKETFDIKLKSLKAHRTELVSLLYGMARSVLVKRTEGEGRKIGAPYAEVYRCGKVGSE